MGNEGGTRVSPDTRSLALLPWFQPSCPGFPQRAVTPTQGRLGSLPPSLEKPRSLENETITIRKQQRSQSQAAMHSWVDSASRKMKLSGS